MLDEQKSGLLRFLHSPRLRRGSSRNDRWLVCHPERSAAESRGLIPSGIARKKIRQDEQDGVFWDSSTRPDFVVARSEWQMADVSHRTALFFPSVTPSGAIAESRGLASTDLRWKKNLWTGWRKRETTTIKFFHPVEIIQKTHAFIFIIYNSFNLNAWPPTRLFMKTLAQR